LQFPQLIRILWKLKYRFALSFIRFALILFISYSFASAQNQINKSVTAGGGARQSNSSNTLYSVFGQAIGNQSSNTFYNLKEGFIFALGYPITIAEEPATHSSTFTVDSVLSAGSIRFKVQPASQITNAKGYYILAKEQSDPAIILSDGTYSALHSSSNSTKVVAISTNITADTIVATGLLPSKTYTFVLIPYNWDGNNPASINYKTDGSIPKLTQATPIPTMGEWALILLAIAIPLSVYFKMKIK
jgi:hypothetical protein